MNTALKEWKTGYVKKTGASGSKLSIKEFIRTKGEEPFTTRIQQSAKGRKILVIADFSGSIQSFQNEYKKAIVSSMEVLDGIGSKTALFSFGGQEGGGSTDGFFSVKKFEEPKWLQVHSAKTAVLTAEGGTPTADVYEGLSGYIRRHRPDVTLTLTDGGPNDPDLVKQEIAKLKTSTKMVAFGIGGNLEGAKQITTALDQFGYSKVFGVSNVSEIPRKLVAMIAPTSR